MKTPEYNRETLLHKIWVYEKLIRKFKEYDKERTAYVHKLEKKYDTSLNEIQNLKNRLIKEHDAFEEYLDAYECAPGTTLSPKAKATYFEMTQRILQLKKDNKKLTEQLSEIVEKNAQLQESRSKKVKKEVQEECSEAELIILRQKLTEKSVALKQLRKERKIMKQLLAKYNLTEEFEHLKTEV